ncbi:MAG: hypothetical protein IPL28_10505 [Chloroflexi bacterium]|nr:hypothetical protein [Chloroflexota bacterium]
MIAQETVWTEIWPVVEQLIQGTLAADAVQVVACLGAGGQAAEQYDLFGLPLFDILLKTVLGRDSLSVTRAIETDEGRYLHIEFLWPEPGDEDTYTAADLVGVKLGRFAPDNQWQVVSINPWAVDMPLTETYAAAVLLQASQLIETGGYGVEPWILPVAVYSGGIQLMLREEGLAEPVEKAFLTGMQQRAFGLLTLLGARRLWRDFRAIETDPIQASNEAAWAAAVEFIACQQALRQQSQAAAGKLYGVGLPAILPRIRAIKQALNLGEEPDVRYTAVHGEQVVVG